MLVIIQALQYFNGPGLPNGSVPLLFKCRCRCLEPKLATTLGGTSKKVREMDWKYPKPKPLSMEHLAPESRKPFETKALVCSSCPSWWSAASQGVSSRERKSRVIPK